MPLVDSPKSGGDAVARITIRLSNDERQALETDANALGLTLASIVKSRTFGAQTKVTRKPTIERIELARFIGQLGMIGNNLNQIARHINKGAQLEDQRALSRMQTDLEVMRQKVVAAVGGKN